MMHTFHELLRKADNQTENQTDFHTASCFLVDIHIYLLYRIFSITLPNIGNKETDL